MSGRLHLPLPASIVLLFSICAAAGTCPCVDDIQKKYPKQKNDPQTMLELGRCHTQRENGKDCYDLTKGTTLITQSAQHGSAQAQYLLGYWKLHGEMGLAKDQTEAFQLLNLAAKKELSAAQHEVGICHEFGYGTAVNLHEAIQWYTKASKNGEQRALLSLKRVNIKLLEDI